MRSREEVERLADLLLKVSETFWLSERERPRTRYTVQNEFFTALVETRGFDATVHVRGADYCLSFYVTDYDEGPVDEARLAAKVLKWALGESVEDSECGERFEHMEEKGEGRV
jgi:hypothetical protein